MASNTGKCYTPTSLWNEIKDIDSDKVVLVVEKNSYGEIDYVMAVGKRR